MPSPGPANLPLAPDVLDIDSRIGPPYVPPYVPHWGLPPLSSLAGAPWLLQSWQVQS